MEESAMSVYEPDAASRSQARGAVPRFELARRGYDRQQVEAYVTDLTARLEESAGRAESAERAVAELRREVAALREGAPPTFEQLGAEAAMVLEQAGRSAELLLDKAKSRSETIVQEAKRVAEQIRAEAAEEAQAALESAREAADQVRQEVQQERLVMHSETEQVREFREGLLEDLGRVHTDIGALLERSRQQIPGQAALATEAEGEAQPAAGDGKGPNADGQAAEPAAATESK
jgi:cell division septum initiation protein DivIVA